LATWLVVVGSGFAAVWRYAAAPGEETRAPAIWPAATHLSRAADRATLVMFVHPHCACSRASLHELGNLLRRVPGSAHALVTFVGESGSELRQIAESLPDTEIAVDDGEESRRFGAATSGATLLYDQNGHLEFSGGLTAVRGHEGNSFGQERVVALLRGTAADRRDSPVFGCPLQDPKEARP
jgi:hypothetical protein